MPRGLMDDLEGEVVDEKVHECALGNDILSADLNGEDALLLNICEYRAFGVSHNVSRFIRSERVGKVSEPLLNMVSECISAFVSHLDIAVCNPHGIYRIMVMQYHRLLRRLGVEDADGDLALLHVSCKPKSLCFISLCAMYHGLRLAQQPFCAFSWDVEGEEAVVGRVQVERSDGAQLVIRFLQDLFFIVGQCFP